MGMPVDSLKRYIARYDNNTYDYGLGIRIDSTKNELADWIKESKKACEKIPGERLHFYIYGDRREQYSSVKKVFDILQEQGENKWSLITLKKSKQ